MCLRKLSGSVLDLAMGAREVIRAVPENEFLSNFC